MTARDIETEFAKAISQAIAVWMVGHREICHDPNCSEPLNLFAYLAHKAGVKAKDMPEFAQHLAEYEGSCAGCQHLRN